MTDMNVERLRALSEKLEQIPRVQALRLESEPGGWRLAYSLLEIEQSARDLNEKLIGKLERANSVTEVEETLHEIGEELSHVVYHIKDSGFFKNVI